MASAAIVIPTLRSCLKRALRSVREENRHSKILPNRKEFVGRRAVAGGASSKAPAYHDFLQESRESGHPRRHAFQAEALSSLRTWFLENRVISLIVGNIIALNLVARAGRELTVGIEALHEHSEQQPKRRLHVDLAELEWAFENASGDTTYLFDRETGVTAMINADLRSELEHIQELIDAQEEGPGMSFEDALDQASPPEWMVDDLIAAHQAEIDESGRYIGVPSDDSREAYRDMEHFVDMVRDGPARGALSRALDGHRPFRRFKDALSSYPEERERWFEFHGARVRQRVLEWLEDEGIESVGE